MSKHGENIYRRKDGRWEGRYKNGLDNSGKTKYSSVYANSYGEVKEILSQKRNDVKKTYSRRNITFGDIADMWLETLRNGVKESTYLNYYTKLQKHILPAFGNVSFEKLSAVMFQEFLNEKISYGYSAKYISDIIALIRSVLKFASKTYGFHDKTYLLIAPKEKKSRERSFLDKPQQEILIAYLTENANCSNIGILLSLLTGIRIGELCALKWSDIDLANKILTVSRTMQRVKNIGGKSSTKILIDSPKSDSSQRVIPIPDTLIGILKQLESDGDDYFLSGSKDHTEPRTMQYRFNAVLKKLGLPHFNFHALRHTFATNCIAVGFDIKTLSDILGHSTVEITLDCYVHSSLERKRSCMNLLDIRPVCR